jgi:hypothetical protein
MQATSCSFATNIYAVNVTFDKVKRKFQEKELKAKFLKEQSSDWAAALSRQNSTKHITPLHGMHHAKCSEFSKCMPIHQGMHGYVPGWRHLRGGSFTVAAAQQRAAAFGWTPAWPRDVHVGTGGQKVQVKANSEHARHKEYQVKVQGREAMMGVAMPHIARTAGILVHEHLLRCQTSTWSVFNPVLPSHNSI